MAAQAIDVVIVHESDVDEWVERLVRGLERAGLQTTTVEAAAVERALSDTAIVDAPILVVAIGQTIGTAIDAADAIYDKSGRPPGGVVPVQLPRAVLGSASVLRQRTGSGVIDLKKEQTFDEGVSQLATSLRSRISRPSPKGATTPRKPATEAEEFARAARKSGGKAGEILEKAWEFARIAEQNRVHVPYVFRALYDVDQRSRDAMRAAADPPDRFLATLQERVRRTEGSDSAKPLSGLPPLSGHVRDGLVAAANVADADESEQIEPIHLLLGMLTVDKCSTVKALEQDGITVKRVRDAIASMDAGRTEGQFGDRVALEPRDLVAGYANDVVAGEDLLGITNEVEALSTLLASRALEPPLALGLFGDWGSGKTFFMTKLQDRIREKALYERDKPKPRTRISYCESIVQLKFNAWHYIDKDLWASLANAIFEGLDEAVETKDLAADRVETRTEKRLRLLAEQDANRRSLEQAKLVQAKAEEAVRAATARLSDLDGADDELARSVGAGDIVAGIYRVATAVPEVGARVDEIARRVDVRVAEVAGTLGIEAADLRADLASGLWGRLRAGWRSLRTRRDLQLWALIAGGSLIVVVLVLLAAGQPLIAFLAAAVLPILSALGAAWVVAAPVMRIVSDARRESRQLIEEKRVDAKRAVEDRRNEAEALLAAALPELEERVLRDADLAAQIRATEPGQAMAQFIRMRRASTAYTSRLGVVAQARDDFEQLSAYLAAEAKEGPVVDQKTGERLVPPVERIVLYIDDLDRCTEKQVVDVLQAVHLLLAFKLFVVVVAVDPRWLVHSLRVRSRALDRRPVGKEGESESESEPEVPEDEVETAAEWEATPMDYLEKIFQVPFALWPMDKDGFARIIADLSRDQAGDHPASDTEPQPEDTNGAQGPARPETGPTTADVDTPIDDQSDVGTATSTGASRTEEQAETVAVVPATAQEVDPDVLRISDAEQAFMTLLHPLIPTPRSAKRFVNVYRLLKASKAREGRHDFEDAAAHRPVLLLLAIVTGFPDLAPAILKGVHRARADERPIWEIVEDVKTADLEEKSDRRMVEQWNDLEPRLAEVKALIARSDAQTTPPPTALDGRLVGEWALATARYSFESSRVLLQYRVATSEPGRTEVQEPAAAGA